MHIHPAKIPRSHGNYYKIDICQLWKVRFEMETFWNNQVKIRAHENMITWEASPMQLNFRSFYYDIFDGCNLSIVHWRNRE